MVGMTVLWAADLRTSYESPFLLGALNFVFSTLASLFIAFLVGRSFLVRGTPGLLLLGCGVIVWGTGSVVSVVTGQRDVNANVTIFNLVAFLAAACHLAGAVLSTPTRRPMPAPGLILASAYTAALGAVALVARAAFADWTPIFFIQGQGGTPVRQAVLAATVVMFLLAALVLHAANRKSLSPFLYWYILALLLIACGLLGVMAQPSFGGALNWTARSTQYLGGVYMLIAAIVSVRDSRAWGISLEAALSEARQRYEDLFELAADGVLVHELPGETSSGALIQANPAFRQLLGYTPAELAALTLPGLVAPEDRAALLRDVEAIAAERRAAARERRSSPGMAGASPRRSTRGYFRTRDACWACPSFAT